MSYRALNKRTRNRKSTAARLIDRLRVSKIIDLISERPAPDTEKRRLFDEAIAELPDQVFRPGDFCAPFKEKIVILVGGDIVQNYEIKTQLEKLGAGVLEYQETDRLLVDIIQDDVQGNSPAKICCVFAMIDYWPGRRNLLDFSLKLKSLLPNVRTAVASRFEAQDNLSKIGTPPIDGTLRLPIVDCSACRLANMRVAPSRR